MNSAKRKVDVVILGVGGGGYPAAFLLDKAGLQVVMADPFGNLGGDCLAEGCIPSKAVREATWYGPEPSGSFGLSLSNDNVFRALSYYRHASLERMQW